MTVRGDAKKLKSFEKILILMSHGKPVTLGEINETLGTEIEMYRISNYMWKIKTKANCVIRAIRSGKKVTGYQLVNVKEVEKYVNDSDLYFKGR